MILRVGAAKQPTQHDQQHCQLHQDMKGHV
jgi:hypothetical protein